MLSINMKTLQLILSSLLVFFAHSYFLTETIAQVQPAKESAQPSKPGDSTAQTTQNATTPVPATATGSSDDSNSETIRQMLRRIEILEERIRELESRQAHNVTLPAVTTEGTTQQATATLFVYTPRPSP